MTNCPRTLLATALIAAGVFGCAGGQTGDEGEAGRCHEEARALALDEASPLGFSPAQVLAYAAGTHLLMLDWQPAMRVPYGPEQGRSELSLGIQTLQRARFVQRSLPDGTITLEDGGCCPDAVQLDVRVTLRTSGGALDESFDAVLEATREGAAYLSVLLKPPLTGMLAFDSRALGSEHLEDVQLDARFAPNELSGALHARFESEPSDDGPDGVVSLSIEPLAEWGSWNEAPLCGE
jgi:hypothetical protein